VSAREFSIRAHFGAPASGKTHALKAMLRELAPQRLLIFDPRREYADFGRSVSRLDYVAERSAGAAFSIAFVPANERDLARRQFSAFCSIAFERGRCVVVADELATVTAPAWAPAGWVTLIRQGRHQAMRVFAAAQRPTEIDGGLFSLATEIRTGRLNGRGDREKLADVLDIDPAEIGELGPRGWIERDMLTGKVSRG